MKNKTKIILCTTIGIMASLYGMSQRALDHHLHNATSSGDLDRMQTLLDQGANVNKQEGRLKETLLMYAASVNDLDTVNLLLKAKANPDIPDHLGFTPLIVAANKGFTEIANALIRAGANLNLRNNAGMTALIVAVYGGNNDIIVALIRNGADITIADGLGHTALDAAKEVNDTEIINFIKQRIRVKPAGKRESKNK